VRGTSLALRCCSFVLFAPCEETHNLPQHLPVHGEAGTSVSHLACSQSYHRVLSDVLERACCAVTTFNILRVT